MGGKETPEDVSMAQAVARFVKVLRPRAFTLENVAKYAYSKSWCVIEATLKECGYIYDVHGGKRSKQLCAADYAVPQTRRRFWVRAVSSVFLPPLPKPTPWQGWYSAVEDLLPSCPESPLANWQRKRLKDHPVIGPLLIGSGGFRGGVVTREGSEPAVTVTGNRNQCDQVRAVLVGDQSASAGQGVITRDVGEPVMTVRAGDTGGKSCVRAITEYRTVGMTLQCMARFQSMPDDYIWSDDAQLNALVNGNAVPPPQYRRLVAAPVRGW